MLRPRRHDNVDIIVHANLVTIKHSLTSIHGEKDLNGSESGLSWLITNSNIEISRVNRTTNIEQQTVMRLNEARYVFYDLVQTASGRSTYSKLEQIVTLSEKPAITGIGTPIRFYRRSEPYREFFVKDNKLVVIYRDGSDTYVMTSIVTQLLRMITTSKIYNNPVLNTENNKVIVYTPDIGQSSIWTWCDVFSLLHVTEWFSRFCHFYFIIDE